MIVKHRKTAVALSIAVATLVTPGFAPVAFGADEIEEVVVTGTRRAPRSATDSTVPIDVFSGSELQNQGTSDMDDLLRTLVPSYNVTRQSISDAATIMIR